MPLQTTTHIQVYTMGFPLDELVERFDLIVWMIKMLSSVFTEFNSNLKKTLSYLQECFLFRGFGGKPLSIKHNANCNMWKFRLQ